jgi:hypothetical protein
MPSRNPLKKLKATLKDLHARHRERHRPGPLGFVFADRIDYLDPARWDAVAATGSVFLRRDRLRLLETHGPDNITPRYAIIFRDALPVAVLAVQIVTVTGHHLHRDPATPPAAESRHSPRALLKRVLAPAVKTTRTRLKERILVAGNLLAWGNHGVAFAPGEAPSALWPAVAEALYRIRRAERLTGQADLALIKDLAVTQAGVEVLRRHSYRPLETEPNMVPPSTPPGATTTPTSAPSTQNTAARSKTRPRNSPPPAAPSSASPTSPPTPPASTSSTSPSTATPPCAS